MKVMPSVLGQIGNDVAGNLFEIGKSAVKGTADAFEQIVSAPGTATAQMVNKPEEETDEIKERRKAAERQRLEAVKQELEQYRTHREQIDRQIEEEKATEGKQKEIGEKKAHESWVSKMINRSQTTTERGRLSE